VFLCTPYSGGSVALGLASGRLSHVCAHETEARVGSRSSPCPVRSRILATESRSTQRVPLSRFRATWTLALIMASSLQVCCNGCLVSPLETWVQQTQLNPARRACGASRYILSRLTAFLTCSCPCYLSMPGKSDALEGHFALSLLYLWYNLTCTDMAHSRPISAA